MADDAAARPSEAARPGRATDTGDTGPRLARALLAYVLAVTLLVTLLPFRFGWPDAWRIDWLSNPIDMAANVLLFVPVGFLWCFARPRAAELGALPVLAIGALLSLAIEAVQLFEATRDTTVVDVAANAIGAWLGAVLYGRIARAAREAGRVIGWLELELPLMALVYLLVPLLWINSLAPQAQPVRGMTTLLIGIFGAILLGGMQRNYFGPSSTAQARDTATFAVLWFVAGAFPLLTWSAAALALGAAAVGAVCWWQGAHKPYALNTNRRFEVQVLMTAAPVYAGYLLITLLSPLAKGVSPWSLAYGFPASDAEQSEILRFLELIAALTLAGYMLAEYRGRIEERYRAALARLGAWSVALAVGAETLRGYELGQSASLARGLVYGASVLYGGWLYHLQRAHVVRLLTGGASRVATRREPPAAAVSAER